jgi:hypothetical protein
VGVHQELWRVFVGIVAVGAHDEVWRVLWREVADHYSRACWAIQVLHAVMRLCLGRWAISNTEKGKVQ